MKYLSLGALMLTLLTTQAQDLLNELNYNFYTTNYDSMSVSLDTASSGEWITESVSISTNVVFSGGGLRSVTFTYPNNTEPSNIGLNYRWKEATGKTIVDDPENFYQNISQDESGAVIFLVQKDGSRFYVYMPGTLILCFYNLD